MATPEYLQSPRRRAQRRRRWRRHRLSTLLHRLVLLLALAAGTGSLVYNALSIINGEGGLVGLSMAVGTDVRAAAG
ncbi:hypothetical protein [uncultured Thiohalocapsa sp.]|uniref:hypothetical protein n=1 Tax=uncultured Thiohalocapsa sp. TaxID=768990 RepID=UPI0025CDC79F|nr:hypothetical protein [uncultured Thiohalocapsa sp.]